MNGFLKLRAHWSLLLALGLLAGTAFVVAVLGDDKDPQFKPRRLLAAQPPITSFPVKSVDEVAEDLNPAELVLGVEIDGQARAYPINMLCGPKREIINDSIAGRPIAATW